MSELTRNIVTDLLPAYFAGECSDETRRAVDNFFKSDPEFARNAKAMKDQRLPDIAIPSEIKEAGPHALERTKRLLKWRSLLLAGAIFFTLSVFSFSFGDGNLTWRLVESPVAAAANATVGVAFWTIYFFLHRKINAIVK